jgi:tetratricopeptide (TPR) repeat protein
MAGGDGTVRLWDVANRKELAAFLGPTNGVKSVVFSPDGGRLAVAGGDGTVRLWDVANRKELATLRGHTGWVESVAFSPDGGRLASAGNDMTVRLWDVASGNELATLKDHIGRVKSVVFSPDGGRLAVAGGDGMVRVYISHDSDADANQRRRVWREQEAAAAERRGSWFAAAFHLTRLLERTPGDAGLFARRGRAYAEQAHWQPALANFARASELEADNTAYRYQHGLALLEQETIVTRAVSGACSVGLLAWPQGPGPLLSALPWVSRTTNRPGYRRLCAEMLERFGNTTDAPKAAAVVSLAVLLPDAVQDFNEVIRLARVAVNSKPDDAGYLESLGGALYRAGQYQDARKYLDRAVVRHSQGGRVGTQLFLALVHQRLGHPAEAKAWLARAVQQFEAMKAPPWEDRVRWRQLGNGFALFTGTVNASYRPEAERIEGEKLRVLGKSGAFRASPQDMRVFSDWQNRWSGDSQLFVTPTKIGDWVDLELPTPADGTYQLVVYLTKAADYGILQFHLNGRPVGQPTDGYYPRVIATGPIDLGSVEVKKGAATLRVEVVGTNAKSVDYRYAWGLDCVLLRRK